MWQSKDLIFNSQGELKAGNVVYFFKVPQEILIASFIPQLRTIVPSDTVEREITHLRESGKFPKPEIKDTSFIWGALRVGGGGI